MSLLNRMISYDKTKIKNQEDCNCEECVSVKTVENQIIEYPKLSETEIEQIISERYLDKDEKTKTFIRKALRKHGDRYDYSKTIYIYAQEKIEIICRNKEHSSFYQKANSHLNGNGCRKCGLESSAKKQRLNLNDFINQANNVHGEGRYDYSKVNYVNSSTKVCIICNNHEDSFEFFQIPSNHLSGAGCPKCATKLVHDRQKLTLEEFIDRSNKIHKEKYDYSKSIYINANTPIEIICPIKNHKSFWQKPSEHLQGSGCPICNCRKLTTEEFINQAKEIHGDEYDYSETEYNGSLNKVCVICHNHEKLFRFYPTANNHLQGAKCPKCFIESKRMSLTEFITKANEIHGKGRYDYSEVDYVNSNIKVRIICNNHKKPFIFEQTPNGHLHGQGCPKCGGSLKLELSDFIERGNEIHGEGRYDYSKVNYINGKTKVCIICNNHDEPFEFLQTPNNHFKGAGCPKCAIKNRIEQQRLTLNEFIEKANEVHGVGTYDYSESEYIDSMTYIKIICLKHGAFWQTPSNHLRLHGCPKCNSSKGEIIIRNYLNKLEIKFEEQKRFEGCRNINLLRFDFYLPKYNLCVEFDGQQHFDIVNFTYSLSKKEKSERLRRTKENDQIKNDYCKKNGINLLRIKYDENVEEELTKYFQEHGIIKEESLFDLVS